MKNKTRQSVRKISKKYSNTLSFEDNEVVSCMCGELDNNLKLLETEMGVSIVPRGNLISVSGNESGVKKTGLILEKIYLSAKNNNQIDYGELKGIINMTINDNSDKEISANLVDSFFVKAGKKVLKPRSKKQKEYFESVKDKEMVFCCGPAGTGKTYLAVAFAVSMLKAGQVEKIILSRPAVEAGERLGFLPGDLKEKIDPYLRPIYDALNEMLPVGEVIKKIESGQIEIAPIAFMRGRTLSNSFIILDESQNTTPIQMKMFLTRLGENSKMIINGDLSQVDLPSGTKSGLREAMNILGNIGDIGFIKFNDKDVVRNALVSRIVRNYEEHEKNQGVGFEYISKASNED
ncbi:PhoH family protein [Rickettsiales bacterium]|nr:PhoH family protein [Rickettsiales bacterium]